MQQKTTNKNKQKTNTNKQQQMQKHLNKLAKITATSIHKSKKTHKNK